MNNLAKSNAKLSGQVRTLGELVSHLATQCGFPELSSTIKDACAEDMEPLDTHLNTSRVAFDYLGEGRALANFDQTNPGFAGIISEHDFEKYRADVMGEPN